MDARIINLQESPDRRSPKAGLTTTYPRLFQLSARPPTGLRVVSEDVEPPDLQPRFGRTLAYVTVGSQEVNTLLVERGYACVLFIPPNVPHQPVNLSATDAAQAIVARTDSNEQETVVPYHVRG